MKASIVIALTKVKNAKTYFEDFLRQTKSGLGERKSKLYIQKLEWILQDFLTTPVFSDEIRESVRLEINSDDLQVDDLYDKLMLLDVNKRNLVEEVISGLLSGEEIKIIENEK